MREESDLVAARPRDQAAQDGGVGTEPSVPPVTQKNLKAKLHSTWDSAMVRMPKKMRV